MTVVHVGWVDSPVPEEEQASLAARLLTDHDCIAVFLPAAMADGYYSGFCKSTLWPLLHYSQVRNFNEGWWEVRIEDLLITRTLTLCVAIPAGEL